MLLGVGGFNFSTVLGRSSSLIVIRSESSSDYSGDRESEKVTDDIKSKILAIF